VRFGGIGGRTQLFQCSLYRIEIQHCRKLVVLYNFRILAPVPGSKKQLHVDLHGIRPDDCTMDSEKNVYTEDDLRQLELRIDELIDTVGSLKNENSSLRQQKDKLVTERSQLIEKTEMARSRVEAMISRLRSLELGS
jgi:cell division protein ZapB